MGSVLAAGRSAGGEHVHDSANGCAVACLKWELSLLLYPSSEDGLDYLDCTVKFLLHGSQ